MTHDPKAPLPDEVEAAFHRINVVCLRDVEDECATIRAHIAAQAEKIAELEAREKRLREALEVIAAQNSGIVGSTAKSDCMASIAKAALAQTEQKA